MQWPRLRFTVQRLMLAVAVVGVLLWAWLYRREHGDIERSLTSNRLQAFAEGDAAHRRMAVEDLAGTRPDDLLRVLPSLAAAAADDDWRTRLAAVHSAGSAARRWTDERQRDEGEEISLTKHLLIRAFDDPRGEVRLEALRYFELLSGAVLPWTTKPPPATPAKADPQLVASLIRLMSDPVPEVRAAAVSAFARIRWESGEGADPVIGVMMRDPEARVRMAAVLALEMGWPDADRLYPLLLGRLQEAKDPQERSTIGWAFSMLPAPPPESVPALLDALAPGEDPLNQTIPIALSKLGQAGRPALPALAKLAAREFTEPLGVNMPATTAVATIDRDSAEAQALIAPLMAMLRTSPESYRRERAGRVLALYGPSAAAAVPSLREALKSDVADVRWSSAWLLGTIGPAARPALADLSALADRDPERNVRLTAAQALKRIDIE